MWGRGKLRIPTFQPRWMNHIHLNHYRSSSGYRLDIHLTPLCHQPALQSHPCVDIDGCYPWPHILFNSSSVSSNLSEGDRTMFNDHQACISIFIKSFTSFSSSAFSFSSAGSTTTTWPFNRCVSTLAKGNKDTSMMSDEVK